MQELLSLSATRLAARLRAREVSAVEVVEAHIRQIQRVNPVLNAMVRDRFEAARAEARAADARLASGDTQGAPLLGVPCSIKEAFALTGMPNSSGLVARRHLVADHDAVAVARLRAAGAIPLGVTNVSELCMWMESNNRVYGLTSNPYDPRRTVGGSSGGEGAIVGVAGAPFGLGSDVGGSIRMPAFFNGVFGHKPTGGLVDNSGQYPLPSAPALLRYVTTGPITRRAEDLAPLLRILAGPDASSAIGDPTSVDLRGLAVLDVEDDGAIRVTPDLRAAQRRAAEALAARGARVRTARVPGLQRALSIWSAMLDEAGGPSFSSMLGCGTPIRAGRELARWMVGRSPHTLAGIGLALAERLPKLLPRLGAQSLEHGRALRASIVDAIGPGGIMLYPSHPRLAPRHHHALFPPTYWVYTAIFNVLELPVTQVPLGLNAAGLPLGVQVAATHGNDHLTIAAAVALEEALGGWVPPPMAGLT